jgi:hypothetical protein
MGFVGFLIDPVDCLVRAGKLADAAELPAIEVPEPAVGAALGPVQFRYGNAFAVELLSFAEDLIRADFRTKIAALTAVLVDGEFHGSAVLFVSTYTVTVTKNLFFRIALEALLIIEIFFFAPAPALPPLRY